MMPGENRNFLAVFNSAHCGLEECADKGTPLRRKVAAALGRNQD
jgi:hypothetical protein